MMNTGDSYGQEIMKRTVGSSPMDLWRAWGPGTCGDVKSQPPFNPDEPVRVGNGVYLSQDLGNMLFGLWTNDSKYPYWLLQLGGGAVQIYTEMGNGRLPSARNVWTYFDDRRGAYFVQRGRNQYDAWKRENQFPR
jgi:hypothetical protein